MFSLITLVCLLLQLNTQAQKAYRDSVINKYVKQGAHQYPIFSLLFRKNIDSALAILPTDAYLWQQKAMPLLKRRKYEIAVACLDSAVKYDEARFLGYRAFAKCIFQKSYMSALEDLFKYKLKDYGTTIMDRDVDFYIQLCYLQLDNLSNAQKYSILGVNRDKKSPYYLDYFYAGVILYELGDYSQALPYFEKSIKDYSQFADGLFYKALCLGNLGFLQQQLDLLNKASTLLGNGYTINEDNAIYEPYPYQISAGLVNFYRERTKQFLEPSSQK